MNNADLYKIKDRVLDEMLEDSYYSTNYTGGSTVPQTAERAPSMQPNEVGNQVLRSSDVVVETPPETTANATASAPAASAAETAPTDDLTPEMKDFKDSIDGIRYTLRHMTEMLKEPIQNHEYDSIISDDIKGRFITMFMYRIMQRRAQDTGSEPPNIIFSAPDRNTPEVAQGKDPWDGDAQEAARQEKQNNLRQYFAKQDSMGRLGKRSLVVTDMIASGDSLRDILYNMPRDYPIDVASVGVGEYFSPDVRPQLNGDAEYYFADWDTYNNSTLRTATGREKRGTSPTSQRREDYDPRLVDFAYAYTQKVADEVYNEVFNKEPELEVTDEMKLTGLKTGREFWKKNVDRPH